MILDRFRLDGRVAIVTGAGTGIGAATAVALAEAGADVVCAARTEADIDATAAAVRATRPARARRTHRRDGHRRPAKRSSHATIDEFGRLDMLVNNAGGWLPRPVLETSERAFEAALRFNVTAAFLLTQLAVPHLAARRRGRGREHLVARREHGAADVRRLRDGEGRAVDDDARAGARARAEGARERDRGRRRRDRGARARARPTTTPAASSRTTRRCAGSAAPDDIAAAVVYLASPASSWVTGKIFEVDGGVEAPAFTVPFAPLYDAAERTRGRR